MKEILNFIAENNYTKAIAFAAYKYEVVKNAPISVIELFCVSTNPCDADIHEFLGDLFCAIIDVENGHIEETSTLIGELAALAVENGSYYKADIRRYLMALRNGAEI